MLEKQYVWSSSLRIAAELDAAGEVVSRFIYGNKVNVPDLIAKPDPVNGDRLYRVITDHLGSPIYIVNIADPSDVMLDATYDEWGNVVSYTSSTGAWPLPMGFAGGLHDEDTGLVRFGARDYDPRVGRWTAKDPIRWQGGQANLYVYIGNDAVNVLDPTGLTELVFNPVAGQLLVLPDGGRSSYVLSASSGVTPYINDPNMSHVPFVGMIPSGLYQISSREVSNPNWLMDILRNITGDWGDWRVRLHARSGEQHGRDKFFLHGGSNRGSAGCIDVGGGLLGDAATDLLLADILFDPDGIVPLYVY